MDNFDESVITMSLDPYFQDDDFNATKYEFSWKVDRVDYKENLITFQLDFVEPLWISSGELQDMIIIKFKKPWMF